MHAALAEVGEDVPRREHPVLLPQLLLRVRLVQERREGAAQLNDATVTAADPLDDEIAPSEGSVPSSPQPAVAKTKKAAKPMTAPQNVAESLSLENFSPW